MSDEREFVAMAEAELETLDDELAEMAREDFDWQLADGVLTAEFEGRGKIIISVNRPARELWVAAGAEGLHFAPAAGKWKTAKGEELRATLSRLFSARAHGPVHL